MQNYFLYILSLPLATKCDGMYCFNCTAKQSLQDYENGQDNYFLSQSQPIFILCNTKNIRIVLFASFLHDKVKFQVIEKPTARDWAIPTMAHQPGSLGRTSCHTRFLNHGAPPVGTSERQHTRHYRWL